MRKILYLIIFACAIAATPLWASETAPSEAVGTIGTSGKSSEKLAYNIYFHMGFIWSKAGYGVLDYRKETRQGKEYYHGQLAAKTLSIVEHLMKVRDTLDCWFNSEMIPVEFKKATHEGSYNCVARNYYTPQWKNESAATLQNVDSTKVTINRWKAKGKDPVTREVKNFTNKGVAYDMLSVFYSIRRLDYAKMAKGRKFQFVCYDGNKQQTIKVEYRGAEKCELRDGKTYDSHLIHMTFDTKGQQGTPLKVWLSKTPDHRPIKAVIALNRIGAVQCEVDE